MKRILVIRGGAIGDFILTLPALKALREKYPDARIEIVGYKHIAALAENCSYADAVRSIEYGPFSGFFAKNGELNTELQDYFGSFDLVISYLFDPDHIFETNLRRAGVGRIIQGPSKIEGHAHAARQLAKPIEQLGIEVNDLSAKLGWPEEVNRFAREFLNGLAPPVIALHVGSGSAHKNWPLENWMELGNRLLHQTAGSEAGPSLVIVTGEADQPQLEKLEPEWDDQNVRFATNLPLPHLGAVLSQCVFIGHDSGISHLAAATGAKCVVLFGPTDPAVWAPQGDNVRVIQAPDGDLNRLQLDDVFDEIRVQSRVDA